MQSLLDSLTELSRLLYLSAQSRSPRLVLRLHNTAFLHAMLCKDIIGQPEILTTRKFYGRYWHSLTAHAAKQNRIISGKSANTEEEERHFNTLQGITKLTNRRPGDVITPSLVRLQAEQQMAETRQGNAVKAQESQISKYYKALPPFPNTIIPNRYIVRNPKEYQAHLQTISDFLICGEGVWWQQIASGVEFRDGPDELNFRPEGPSLHHFRSSSLALEEEHLNQCWEICLADEAIRIPHRVIRLYGDNGDCIPVIHIDFLDDDNEGSSDEENENADNIKTSTSNEQCELEHWDDDTEEQAESVELTAMDNEVFHALNKDPSVCYDSNDEDGGAGTQGLQILKVSSLSTPDEHQSLQKSSSGLHNVPSRNDTVITSTPECKQSGKKFATKLCKNIAKILGETDDVYRLDKAREDQKSHPTSPFYNEKYQNLLSVMQTKILTKHTSLKKEHSNWEKEYCLKHDFHEPNLDDVKKDKKEYSVYKKIILCDELLKYWGVTVHLY